jgi:hypothetical protein
MQHTAMDRLAVSETARLEAFKWVLILSALYALYFALPPNVWKRTAGARGSRTHDRISDT